jgi:hypothetical protein
MKNHNEIRPGRRTRNVLVGLILLAIIIKLTEPYYDSKWNHERSLQELESTIRGLAVVYLMAESDSANGASFSTAISFQLRQNDKQRRVVCPLNKTVFQYNVRPDKMPEEVIVLSLSKSTNGVSYGFSRNGKFSPLSASEIAKVNLKNFTRFPALDTK